MGMQNNLIADLPSQFACWKSGSPPLCWCDMQRICNKGGMTRALSGVLFHNAARLLLFFPLSQRMRERFKNVLMSKRGGDGEPRSSAHREKRQSCGFYMYVFFLSLWSAIILLNNPLGVGTWGVAEEEKKKKRARAILFWFLLSFYWLPSSYSSDIAPAADAVYIYVRRKV